MYENEQIIAVSLYSEGSVCLSRPTAPAARRARTTSREAPLLVHIAVYITFPGCLYFISLGIETFRISLFSFAYIAYSEQVRLYFLPIHLFKTRVAPTTQRPQTPQRNVVLVRKGKI